MPEQYFACKGYRWFCDKMDAAIFMISDLLALPPFASAPPAIDETVLPLSRGCGTRGGGMTFLDTPKVPLTIMLIIVYLLPHQRGIRLADVASHLKTACHIGFLSFCP
jgi:hypothetical protein